jgi:hypothetical protein
VGKAIFRSSKDLELEGPNTDKTKIKIIKARKNMKLNIIIALQLLNLALLAYLMYSLVVSVGVRTVGAF